MTKNPRHMVALLLLGGAGTRLWPLSTEKRPKQFLRLFERSLFQLTLARLAAVGCSDFVVVTSAAMRDALEADMRDMAQGAPHIILEPVRCDSGPAIAAGVAYVRKTFGGDATVGVFPCDHLIREEPKLAEALRVAEAVAAKDYLVTFGIAPTFAATGYGYIERGAPLAEDSRSFAVSRFHEKPDLARAETYLRQGAFDWNSGMFVFTVGTFVAEAERHMPDIWQAATAAVAAGVNANGALLLDAAAFGSARKTSIDYALFEKSERVAVVPAAFSWSDVGDWPSVYDALDKDANGNAVIGDVRMEGCVRTLAVAEGVPLAIAGLTDMVVIATPDGTFAAPRARAADVKRLIGG